MLRTAEEIMKEINRGTFNAPWVWETNEVKEVINKSRKEAIEECAERAKAYPNCASTNSDGSKEGVVDKQSILLLINQLK